MKQEEIIKDVMSQHFKIQDDYNYENVVDALKNFADRLLVKPRAGRKEAKEAFEAKYWAEFREVLKVPFDERHKTTTGKFLIEKARTELGYSCKTGGADVLRLILDY